MATAAAAGLRDPKDDEDKPIAQAKKDLKLDQLDHTDAEEEEEEEEAQPAAKPCILDATQQSPMSRTAADVPDLRLLEEGDLVELGMKKLEQRRLPN